jgi:NADPH:quinone reductase-like Zn-dependent oxidoreductase
MKALKITQYGSIKDSLDFQEVEIPEVLENDVLIEVVASATNPIDNLIIEGFLKDISQLQFPAPIGFDVSGIVAKKGNKVTDFEIGDKVFSRVPTKHPGSFAEFIAVDSSAVAHMPNNVTYEEAASIPLVGLTSLQSLERVSIKEGDRVLIHAGSGGVGSFAIQYAKSKGAYVFTTTSTDNVSWVKSLGADRVIDYKTENYKDIVDNIDIVFDTLGKNYTIEAFDVIKEGGRVTSIKGPFDEETAKLFGMSNYKIPEDLVKAIVNKKAVYKLTMMQPNGKQLTFIKQLIEEGKIKPVVDKVFPFHEAINALMFQKTGIAKGKIVIKIK